MTSAAAQRLKSIGIWFKGPVCPEVFKLIHVESRYRMFDRVSIGTGESKAVAASRAIAHLELSADDPLLEEIAAHIQVYLPIDADRIETDSRKQVYCILAIEVNE